MAKGERTLYAQVDFTDAHGHDHQRGDAVQFAVGDKEGSELLRRGVLSTKPVRREAGQSSGRSGGGRSE